MPLTDNILSFDIISPNSKAKALARRVKQRRLELNLTQEGLSTKAGITLAACRRFEQTGKISLDGLLHIAYALDALNDFDQVFATPRYTTLDEAISASQNTRKGGNAMSEKVVEVLMDSRKVGRLALNGNSQAMFEYDSEWIRNGFSISPIHLPLESKLFFADPKPFGSNFGVFDDSLPDGWSALVLDRFLRSQGKSLASLNLLEQLMFVGSRGRGALEYRPDLSTVEEQDIIDLDRMAEESQRVLNTDYSGDLDKAWQGGGTSGGTRPKVFVHCDDAEWLVKFRDRTDPPEVGKIEYEASLLARECGIEMPETRLFEGKYFGTKRFDRTSDGGKLHVISLSALMNLDYHLPSADYGHLFWACSELTHSVKELWKVFRLMAFNLIIGNCDDHVKNFAFIRRDGIWQLSPAYDILPCEGHGGFHSLSVNGNYKDPGKEDAVQLAEKFGLKKHDAEEVFEEIVNQIKTTRK